ncbi:hypothetical protein CO2235_MP80317 [Cupriavidus oxalaticus]|uniref:Uncharacterized protein n=1 Tax=Cupriavidus oxalaticus TaxID=96344 RepID=A0A375GRM8_9BURK|nr:hypothetical protein CO2235_U770173 [Cupriavidus oxalaticus]SPC24437.1 hypothetical protein CO2235_MP80317 [Cupriavidus oxalaticus]
MGDWRRSRLFSWTVLVEIGCREFEQLRNRFDVPVRKTDVDMPEVGGEFRHFPTYVATGTIPLDQPSSREAMPEVLEAWAVTIAPILCRRSQTDSARHSDEHTSCGAGLQSLAALTNQERLAQS